MLFRYRAVDSSGHIQQGTLEAASLAELEWRLCQQQLQLIRARRCLLQRHIVRNTLQRRDLIDFCFHLEQLIQAGIPLIDGLQDLRDHASQPQLRAIVAGILADVEGGKTMSQALAAYPGIFDCVFVQLVRAGECSGTLPQILRELVDALKWQDELAAQMRKILLYPAFVGVLVGGVLIFLLLVVLPQLVVFVQEMGQQLPWGTRLLVSVSTWLRHHGWLILPGLILAGITLHQCWRRHPGLRRRIDGAILHLPLIGQILHKIILARFARIFAMLYAAGIPILDCLHISAGLSGNSRISDTLQQLSGRIAAGTPLSAGFRQAGLFPALTLRMLHIGETTGALDTALHNVAYFYGRDVRESIASIQVLIEPVLIVVLGLMLAGIMSAVLGPIFDTIGAIR